MSTRGFSRANLNHQQSRWGGRFWGAHVVRWGVNLNETTSFGDLEHIIKNIQKPNLKPNFEFDHQEIWTSTIFYPFFCFPNTFRQPFYAAKRRGQCHLRAMDGLKWPCCHSRYFLQISMGKTDGNFPPKSSTFHRKFSSGNSDALDSYWIPWQHSQASGL